MSFTPSTKFQFARPWTGIPRFQWPEDEAFFVWFDSTFPSWTGSTQIATPASIQFGGTFPPLAGGFEFRIFRLDITFNAVFPIWAGQVQITLPKTISFDGVFPAWSGSVAIQSPLKMTFSGAWTLYLAGFVDFSISINVGRPSISRFCATHDAVNIGVNTIGAGSALIRRIAASTLQIENAIPVTLGTTGATRDMRRRAIAIPDGIQNGKSLAINRISATRDMRRLAMPTYTGMRDGKQIGFGLISATRDMRRLALLTAGITEDGRRINISRIGAVTSGRWAAIPWSVGMRDARILSTANWRFPIPLVEPPEPPAWENQNPWEFRWFRYIPNRPFFQWPDLRWPRIPIREVYIVTTTATLVRLSDGAEIDTISFSVQADTESSYWKLSAGIIGRTAYNLLQPVDEEPMAVALIVSGCSDWHFIVDRVTGSRQFRSETFTLTGRTPTSLLGPGWARARTYTESEWRTRRQLADQELLFTGWEIDPWEVPDWLLPGGSSPAWSYQGLTPIEAIRSLIEIDGYILPHPNLAKIGIYPRYKTLPWLWSGATPDLVVPSAVVLSVGIDPRFNRNAGVGWNAVFVRGSGPNGGFWKVKRTDTAGDVMPDDALVSPLMTHVDGARAWGGRWLADGEPLIAESLILPLDLTIGIPLVNLGDLIEYQTQEEQIGYWRGIIRDFSLIGRVQGAGLVLQQAVTVERYVESL